MPPSADVTRPLVNQQSSPSEPPPNCHYGPTLLYSLFVQAQVRCHRFDHPVPLLTLIAAETGGLAIEPDISTGCIYHGRRLATSVFDTQG